MVYCFDIDGTICNNTEGDYDAAIPHVEVIQHVNGLKAQGHRVIFYTARGATTGIDWRIVTERQLAEWGVQYDALHMSKPTADVYVDDKAINVRDWARQQGLG